VLVLMLVVALLETCTTKCWLCILVLDTQLLCFSCWPCCQHLALFVLLLLLLLLQAHCRRLLLSTMLLLLRVLSWQPRWMHCGSS
jgi:hypothetical protein